MTELQFVEMTRTQHYLIDIFWASKAWNIKPQHHQLPGQIQILSASLRMDINLNATHNILIKMSKWLINTHKCLGKQYIDIQTYISKVTLITNVVQYLLQE